MTLLRVRDLDKSFLLDNIRHPVLKKLSLTVNCSGSTVILGRSGCGKTTLLRLICGLDKPDGGSIELPAGLKIGMMFQEARLMPWLTCRENIAFGVKAEVSYIDELLETVGLTKFAAAYPHQLSGGMQQRTALARTLACRSKLILMDEPFAALDYFTRLQMQQELLRLQKLTGSGFVLVTHNIEEALTVAETIHIISEGRIARSLSLPSTDERDILKEPYLSFKKEILNTLMNI